MRKLVRGATYTPCFGAYTDKPHYMIYTTLTSREAGQLQEFIHKENLECVHVHAEYHRGVRQGFQSRIIRIEYNLFDLENPPWQSCRGGIFLRLFRAIK